MGSVGNGEGFLETLDKLHRKGHSAECLLLCFPCENSGGHPAGDFVVVVVDFIHAGSDFQTSWYNAHKTIANFRFKPSPVTSQPITDICRLGDGQH